MRVYVAGPYSHPDPVLNTHNAILAGEELHKRGFTPYIPHLNMLWHTICPHEADFWYAYDLEWLPCCDALLRLPGDSQGADREIEVATRLGIPVFTSIEELYEEYLRRTLG